MVFFTTSKDMGGVVLLVDLLWPGDQARLPFSLPNFLPTCGYKLKPTPEQAPPVPIPFAGYCSVFIQEFKGN